jgi:hypothetical protein
MGLHIVQIMNMEYRHAFVGQHWNYVPQATTA